MFQKIDRARGKAKKERERDWATPRNRLGIGSPTRLFPQKMIISDCIIWSECKLLSQMFSSAASLYRIAPLLYTFHNHRSSASSSPFRVSTSSTQFILLLLSNGDEGSAEKGLVCLPRPGSPAFPSPLLWIFIFLTYDVKFLTEIIIFLLSQVPANSLFFIDLNVFNFYLQTWTSTSLTVVRGGGGLRPLLDDSSDIFFFSLSLLIFLHW